MSDGRHGMGCALQAVFSFSMLAIMVGMELCVGHPITPPFSRHVEQEPVGGVFCFGVGVALLIGVSSLSRARAAEDQAAANAAALGAFSGEPSSSGTQFLYLRPFSVDTLLLLRNPYYQRYASPFSRAMSAPENPEIPFDLLLSRGLAGLGEIHALAPPGADARLGPGKAVSPVGDWMRPIMKTARAATGILVLPLKSPSTNAEVILLWKRGLFDRTIFLMPPWAEGYPLVEEWTLACRYWVPMGLKIPEYVPSGMLFTLGKDGRVSTKAIPVDWRKEHLEAAVLSLWGTGA